MLHPITRFALGLFVMVFSTSSVSAEKYVTRSYRVPARIQPINATPLRPTPRQSVVQTSYVIPERLPRRRSVVVTPTNPVAPAAVVVPRRRSVHEVVRVQENRTKVRVLEYAPLAIFPTSKRVIVERDTPRGVVTRQRGR